MKTVMQTQFGEGNGNCHQACLASILELELEDVPHFCRLWSDQRWLLDQNRWLKQFGMTTVCLAPAGKPSWKGFEQMLQGAWTILGGHSDRGVMHSVVGRGITPVHDPHPSGTGIKRVETVMVFVVRDPQLSILNSQLATPAKRGSA